MESKIGAAKVKMINLKWQIMKTSFFQFKKRRNLRLEAKSLAKLYNIEYKNKNL